MKKILAMLLVFAAIAGYSCKDPSPGSYNPAETTVDIGYFLVFCDDFFEGVQRGIKVRINVDRYDGNGNFQSNYKNYRFNVKNDDGNSDNTRFKVEVPETGTYAVSVEIEGTECYKCCQGSCTNYFPAWGYPFWRGVSTQYNSFPPPSVIYVTPSFVSCD